jgi:hypothetical protein
MGKWSKRDVNAKNYGEMGSNPFRKANGKKRGMKAGKQKQKRKSSK